MFELPPLSLYIHIPWCVRKCPYCDFNSHAARDALPEEAYVAALLADLDRELVAARSARDAVDSRSPTAPCSSALSARHQASKSDATGVARGAGCYGSGNSGDRPLQSIFIGGGTPSLFSAAALQQILAGVAARVPFAPDIEITMEANPGTFEQAKFEGFRAAGVNRLSIGVQSFQDAQLQALGRIHSGAEAIRAIHLARELFDNINLDLMHGLPGQTLDAALADLRQALALAPDHLSWYQLTIEPNTEFHARPPRLPVDETLWEIQEQGQQLLAQHGFAQYEISAYARPGRQARHNLNYWRFGDYIGIGAGAHGKLTLTDGRIIRRWKQRQPKAYLQAESRVAGCELIERDALPFEFMMNALRLSEGVESALFSQRTGLPLDVMAGQLDQARRRGLLTGDSERLQPTQQGRLFLNDLLEMFL